MENNLSIVKDQVKELPNNIEAEQAVIGSLLVNNEIYDEISLILDPEIQSTFGDKFFDPMHQKIFNAIRSMIFKGMLLSEQHKVIGTLPVNFATGVFLIVIHNYIKCVNTQIQSPQALRCQRRGGWHIEIYTRGKMTTLFL